ncbi:hypothetical protein C7B62_11715 [Pleurocapsa sp. CCALA 161]|uniref:hypothetical protein n=1 Tax=Pleurocapsa sp. CCALA 161 TaxID=2107688 RepID=UPI000D06C952|nr:hypothetical protein [Pleurocapsa sp. CCALA 161]PSB09812.1 hypothetical protein C7B62_11715 [Pleurocapsa sp. CCALA 161]
MKVKGIIKDNKVQLPEAITVPDGTEVTVEISDRSLSSAADQWQRLQQVAGAWQDDSEIDEVFAEIDRERHAYRGRDIDFSVFE